MSRLKKILRNRCGEGALYAVIAVLAVLLLATAVWEYARLYIIAGGVRDAVQSSIISVATTNYDEVYNGLREGYSGGYVLYGASWDQALDTGDIYSQLDKTLSLSRQEGRHVKFAGDALEYALWGLDVKIINAPFAPSNPSSAGKFLAKATIELEAPLSFGWAFQPPMRVTLHVKAGYTPKF